MNDTNIPDENFSGGATLGTVFLVPGSNNTYALTPLGCNSTFFYTNGTDVCEEIGGKWNATAIICEAANITVKDQMMNNSFNKDMDLICFNEAPGQENGGASTLAPPFRPYGTSLLALLLTLMMLVAGVHSTFIPTSLDSHLEYANLVIRDRPLPCFKQVEKVGNGDPHPSCKFRQVTGNLDCNHQDCQSSHAQGREFSWSVAGNAGSPFATLGFDVLESYTSENTYSCSPKDGAQKICVIAVVSYTEYTAKEVVQSGDCLGIIHSTPYIIRAPDKGHRQNFRCEVDAGCVELDHEIWEHNGKACP